jgi:hypothetical protein
MSVFQADSQDSDLATAQTIKAMCEHIHRAAKDPVVRAWAVGGETKMRMGAAGSGCFWYAKHFVKQLPHSQFKALLAAFPQKRQLLIAPEVVVRAANPAGDCSTFSMLIAAMLESLGIRWELVTVAVEPSDPSLYSHVFVRAVSGDGIRLTLDGSHGKYPGWEVPRARQFRRQVWDESGDAVVDEAPAVSQLHAYRFRPGLGQDDDDDTGGTYTDSSALPGAITDNVTVTPQGPTLAQLGLDDTGDDTGGTYTASSALPGAYVTSTGATYTGTVINVPSQSSAQWASAVTALSKAGLTLAEINTIQPGTVVGANGQILRQATGLPVPVGSGVTAALGSNGTALLLLGGAALLVMFMVMGNKR